MLSLPRSSRSSGQSGTGAAPTLASDTQMMVLEYLAAECMEATLLSMVGHHPLVIQCLDTVRLPLADAQTSFGSNGHQLAPQVIHVEDSSDEEAGINSSGDVTMDIASDYAPSPVKLATQATCHQPLSVRAQATTTNGFPIEQTIGKLSFHFRTLRVRKELKALILKGQIQAAKSILLHYFPHLTSPSAAASSEPVNRFSLLLARLDCQSFIELIRAANHKDTLKFSQSNLSPYLVAARQPDASAIAVASAHLIGQVYGLIAYPDPYTSPLADFLDARHRQRLAEDVNVAILASAHQDRFPLSSLGGSTGVCGGSSALEKVVRQALATVMAKGASPVEARETVLM